MKKENSLSLTPREIEVMEQIKAGNPTSKGIAAELVISPATVKNHMTDIYLRLGVGGERTTKKIRALVKAVNLGLIPGFEPSINEEETPLYKLGQKSLASKD